MERVTKMQETRLWKSYQNTSPDAARLAALEEVYENAVNWLKVVPKDFSNYTLHDETHVVNVMEAMAGLLGDQIGRLSRAEHELLLLAAMLHDIGMVYSPEAKKRAEDNRNELRSFLQRTAPGLCGARFAELDAQQQQDYLRSRHASRVDEVLRSEEWKKVSETIEDKLLPLQTVVAVCRAHGETEDALDTEELHELTGCDPRFCALLLRLGDILDFDGSRAPEILFPFTDGIGRSVEAFRKHLASRGFAYPEKPSDAALPYSASCDDPNTENKLRDYLYWVDHELATAERVKKSCADKWRNFPFPRAVSRRDIRSENYDSADFRITMDQAHILKLLTGENLYQDETVFVRELLQNAIDATLLRAKLDAGFKLRFEQDPDAGAIRLWEWTDDEGRLWFRIDDQGTGMTRRMLLEYFLKVGNSYYESKELQRDLEKSWAKNAAYTGISRFGIGFLSCFLCGTRAEISTLSFDKDKCREDNEPRKGHAPGWGLRLSIPGLTGRYVLRNQAKGHTAKEPLPCRKEPDALHCEGYRMDTEPGTSIVLLIDQGKLGARSLRDAARDCLCAPRMPVYYNGEKLVPTYAEVMEQARKLEAAGPRYYELDEEQKKKLKKIVKLFQVPYPKLEQTVTVFGAGQGKYDVLPGFSGIAVRNRVVFERTPLWKFKDQEYTLLLEYTSGYSNFVTINFILFNTTYKRRVFSRQLHNTKFDPLFVAFNKYCRCPSVEELGKLWTPYSQDYSLPKLWKAWVDQEALRTADLPNIIFRSDQDIAQLTNNPSLYKLSCVFHGIKVGKQRGVDNGELLCLLEDVLRPDVDLGRAGLRAMPQEAALYGELLGTAVGLDIIESHLPYRTQPLSFWRALHGTPLEHWAKERFGAAPKDWIAALGFRYVFSADQEFLRAILQNTRYLTVRYERKGFTIEDAGARPEPDPCFEMLPPLLFCKAADEDSRRCLCSDDTEFRRCLTEDHPFSIWLLAHAQALKDDWPRQLDQLLTALTDKHGKDIIQTVEDIRAQWARLPASKQRELGLNKLPRLTEADFWKETWWKH